MPSFDRGLTLSRRLCSGAPLLAAALIVAACGGSGEQTAAGFEVIRLQDMFDGAAVTGGAGAADEIAPTEIRFDDAAGIEWSAARGLEALELENGRLVGTTNDIVPFVHIERTGEVDNGDALYSIEIRARVSADTRLGISFSEQRPNYDAQVAMLRALPWPLIQEVTAADEIQTYTFLADQQGRVPAASTRHILIRPADEVGADFEIESIRLTFLQEHLASIPSGIGWQGLDGVFHETIITRSPERASFELTLPGNPWLDLSVGTLEPEPVTFRVTASHDGHELVLGERIVTAPQVWEAMPVDLAALAGETVTLTLELEAGRDNALGFWGSPAVRNRLVAQAESPGGAPRGVILFVADTLRRDHLSTYGYERETSPVLTRLALEGALVEDAQAHAIWTKVSVPSIHTSLYPRTHTVQRFFDLLPPTATTLAEVYREAGYATLSLTSNAFVGRATNLHQGFEEVHEPASLPGAGFSKSARPFVDRVIPWLEAHRDGPFFINVHVTDPHSPYPGYEPYDTMWGDDASRATYQRIQTELREAGIGGFGGGPDGEPKTESFEAAGIDAGPYVQQEINWYDGSIRAMDAEIGRLVEAIERFGLSNDVLFAFISDHGEEFLEHGSHFHLQIYGPNSNVPLVLWAPGTIEPGTVIGDTLQSIDLMPTMLDLGGLAVPEAAQGQSFASLLVEPPRLASSGVAYAQSVWRPAPAFTEQLRDDNGTEPGPFPRDAYAVVEGDWKLVHNVHVPEGMDYPEYELFDHANDPLDQVDLAAENPEVVVRLSQLIDDWLAYALAEQLPAVQTTLETMDPAELRRLCALGYIACP